VSPAALKEKLEFTAPKTAIAQTGAAAPTQSMPPLPSVTVKEGGWEIHATRRALEAPMDFNAKKSALKQLVLRNLKLIMTKML
jgi:hypothetical protein